MIGGFVLVVMVAAFGVLIVSAYNNVTYREAIVLTVDYVTDVVRTGITWIGEMIQKWK